MNQNEKITQLVFDYLTCLAKSDDDYEDEGERKFDLEEKYNAIYDACHEILGFPSLGEICATEKITKEEIEAMIKSHSIQTGKLVSDLIFASSQIIINGLDCPIEKKASLLAEVATNKENVPLYYELKVLGLKLWD